MRVKVRAIFTNVQDVCSTCQFVRIVFRNLHIISQEGTSIYIYIFDFSVLIFIEKDFYMNPITLA